MGNVILATGIEVLSLFFLTVMYFYHQKVNKKSKFNSLKGIYMTGFGMILANISRVCISLLNLPKWCMFFAYSVNIICLAVLSFLWIDFNVMQLQKELSYILKLVILFIYVTGIILSSVYSILPYVLLVFSAFFVIALSLYGWDKLSKAKKENNFNVIFSSLVLITGCFFFLVFAVFFSLTPVLVLALLIQLLYTLYSKIVTDRLTRIKNRYGMDEELEEQLIQYRKDKSDSFYLITCDLDDFKSINDEHGGHKEGDRALTLVADILTRVTEKNNATAFRNGGDEFVIITDKSDEQNARNICGELEKEFEALHFRDDFKIKMSIGMALFDGKASVEELMARADQFLYDEKRRRKSE